MSCPNSSFGRIPVSYAFNREIYDIVHRSTKIKEDALLTLLALKDIKSHEFEYAKYKLQNIINVYNENAKYINNSIKNESHFEERTYEQYCANNSRPSYSDYQHDESLRQHKLFKTMDEEAQISQLGYLFPKLAKKITRAAERLNAKAPADTLQFTFDLMKVENRYDHDLFAPRLRKIEVPNERPKAPAPLTLETPAISAPIIDATVAPAPLTLETPATPAPIIDVTVLVNLGLGQTLGICCDPHWAEQPISFTPCENGWQGQVPMNQPWKFVTLENGKVANWEQMEGNRFCDDQTKSFTVQANEVKF